MMTAKAAVEMAMSLQNVMLKFRNGYAQRHEHTGVYLFSVSGPVGGGSDGRPQCNEYE